MISNLFSGALDRLERFCLRLDQVTTFSAKFEVQNTQPMLSLISPPWTGSSGEEGFGAPTPTRRLTPLEPSNPEDRFGRARWISHFGDFFF